MSKVVTLRLSDEEYRRISFTAKTEHRPLSNFITYVVIRQIEESSYTDSVETAQIFSDDRLVARLKKGHQDARRLRGRFAG